MNKKRYLESPIDTICFAANKMAFISGPRQCGKTTMAKNILRSRTLGNYYNWDELKFRKLWTKDPTQIIQQHTHLSKKSTKPLIILDEIHKARLWKRSLKGVYDTLENPCDILVTGSACMNVYRKGGDSLLGRYYYFHMHPFSLAEMLGYTEQNVLPEKLLENLEINRSTANKIAYEYLNLIDKFGPFPEPLFAASPITLNLWQRGRSEKIIREDLRDISHIPELSQIEMLVSLLPERVANPLSIQALSEDLEVAYTTIKRWLLYLKELYYYFDVKPYHKSIKRSLKKPPKFYLWDWSEVTNEATRFENLIAFHLLKYCDYLTDTGVGQFQLRYIRNKEQKEIDFLLLQNNIPWMMIETKLNNQELSPNWHYFMSQVPCKLNIQVVKQPNIYKKLTTECGEILIISADCFLANLI